MSRLWGYIKARTNLVTTTTDSNEDDYVTSTPIDSTKRALDHIDSFSNLVGIANLLIKGTLPEVNFDRILKTKNSDTSYQLAFVLTNSVQFYMNITSFTGDFDINIDTTQSLGLETNVLDVLLLESGDELLKETA